MESHLESKKLKQGRIKKYPIDTLQKIVHSRRRNFETWRTRAEEHSYSKMYQEEADKAEAELKIAEQELQKAIEQQHASTEVPPETPQMPAEPIHPKPQDQDTDCRNETEVDTDTGTDTDTPADTKNNVLDTLLEKVKGGGNKIVNTLIQKFGDKNE